MTTLYTKHTDSLKYLDCDHCKDGIFVGQVRRIRRICRNGAVHVYHLSNLKASLAERDHPHDVLKKAYNEAYKLGGTPALEKKSLKRKPVRRKR